MSVKYKTKNPYRPLRPAQGVQRAIAACPSWRMVTARGSGDGAWWIERRATGESVHHAGDAPMQCGVVCDDAWRPVVIVTQGNRELPVLSDEWDTVEAGND